VFGPRLIEQPLSELREKYMAAATHSVGYADFGPLDFVEPFELMLHDLVAESRLSALGHLIAPYYLKQILKMRLRVQRASSQESPVSIDKPIFILGLPRTGSSLLHELLDSHSDLQAPTFWASHHWPATRSKNLLTQSITRAQVAAVDVLAPTFRRTHSLAALKPHECVSIQGYSFRSMQFHVAFRLPSYNRWMVDGCNWAPAYDWHKKYLRFLPDTGRRWILKAPGHMLGLKALITAYPDARFIQTHRNPLEVIPSMASLTQSLRGLASRHLDAQEIGRDVHELWHHGLNNVMLARAADPSLNERFFDIGYRRLIDDPHQSLRDISSFIDLKWTKVFDEKISAHLNKNSKHRHGKHTDSAEQFGLDPAQLNLDYADYTDEYLK
jgi:hypothetical protein